MKGGGIGPDELAGGVFSHTIIVVKEPDRRKKTGTMLYEVEVTEGENSPLALDRVFDLLEDPRPVGRVVSADLSGNDVWCQVIGWDETGPCQALAALAEDSGDGVILLVFGGSEGIRLKPDGDNAPWDLADGSQWGEPCLMLDKETQYQC